MAEEVIASLVGRVSFEVDDKGLADFVKRLKDAEKRSDEAKKPMGALERVADRLDKSFRKAGRGVGKFALDLAKRLPAAAAAGTAAVVATGAAVGIGLTKNFIESGAELDRWARKMGTSTQELQRLEFAGRAVGAESDNVREAFKTLTENLGELERVGSGPAKDALGTLGLELGEFQALDATSQIELFAEAISTLPNDAQKVSVALEVMGEDGGALLPLFEQGAEGVRQLTDRADELGLVLDDQAIRAAKEAKQSIGELTAQAVGFGQQIGAKLAPKVTELVQRVQAWWEQNQDLIDQRVDQVIEAVVPAMESLVEVTGDVIDVGADLIEGLGGVEGAAKATVVVVGALTVALGGIPAAVAAAAAALSIGMVSAANEATSALDEAFAAVTRLTGGKFFGEEGRTKLQQATDARGELSALSDADLAQLSTAEFNRRIDAIEAASTETAGDTFAITDRLIRRRERGREDLEARRPAPVISAENIAQGERNQRAEERARRRRKFERKAKGGGKGIDTTQAEAQLGDQIRTLARGAGATEAQTQQAIESAAQSLKGKASAGVALQAAAGTLGSLTGVDVNAAGGADAALFQQLTTIGGATAARTATEGARFVRIDQSVNIDVGGIDLKIPEEWAGAISERGAEGMAEALRTLVAEQVIVPIVERAQGQSARP